MSLPLGRDALRILDANLNRAREALRLVEDYARFALDDADLSGRLKAIRHDLADATRTLAADAILWRDTPGDVGTRLSTAGETHRADVAHAITAAGKRFGEAVRVIEELLKVADPAAAGRIEQVRYAFYDIEHQLAFTLRAAGAFVAVRVYVLVTEAVCRRDWLATAELALTGGADMLQLREPGLPSGELLARAMKLNILCKEAGVPLIINDRPDIALLSGAAGVHVGQTDLPAVEARRIVGSRALVGVSTHNLNQVKQARRDGADYVGVGPVFPSSTKPRDILPGLDFARAAAELAVLPTVAIAGITRENASQVWQTGVTAVAVASSVTMADDPAAAVRALRETRHDENTPA